MDEHARDRIEQARLKAAAQRQRASSGQIESGVLAHQMGEDRSRLSRYVIFIYGIGVIATLASLGGLLNFYLINSLSKASVDVALQIVDPGVRLLQTAVVPVVTLVLGFYFGSRKTE